MFTAGVEGNALIIDRRQPSADNIALLNVMQLTVFLR
jgi:hypothetical protein